MADEKDTNLKHSLKIENDQKTGGHPLTWDVRGLRFKQGVIEAPLSRSAPLIHKTIKILYTTQATATGGREGSATTAYGVLDVLLSTPKKMGGPGASGTNPEQLFQPTHANC